MLQGGSLIKYRPSWTLTEGYRPSWTLTEGYRPSWTLTEGYRPSPAPSSVEELAPNTLLSYLPRELRDWLERIRQAVIMRGIYWETDLILRTFIQNPQHPMIEHLTLEQTLPYTYGSAYLPTYNDDIDMNCYGGDWYGTPIFRHLKSDRYFKVGAGLWVTRRKG